MDAAVWTNDYIGIPFKGKGRERDEGLDCWGLARVVYHEQFGIMLPSMIGGYKSTNDMVLIQELIDANRSAWQKAKTPRVGDIVTLSVMGYETHLGIYVGNERMLHVMKGQDTCLQNLASAGWSKRVTGYYRHAQMTN